MANGLVKFLLARITETEKTAEEDDSVHLAPIWTDYVIDDCTAKRRIIADLSDYTHGYVWTSGTALRAELALRALALTYAEHPDYQEEWRL